MKKLLIILIGILLLGQGGCGSEDCDGISEEYNSLNIREEACYSMEHFHIVFLDKNTGKNLLDTGELPRDSLIIKGKNNEIIPFDTITTSLGLGITPRWGKNSFLCDSLENYLISPRLDFTDTIKYTYTLVIECNNNFNDSLRFDFVKNLNPILPGECPGILNEVFFIRIYSILTNSVLDTLYYYLPKGTQSFPLYPIDTLLEIYK